MISNPAEDLESLIEYLKMSDEEKALDLLYSQGWYVLTYTRAVEDTVEDDLVPICIREELTNLDKDEILEEQLSEGALKAVAAHLDIYDVIIAMNRYDPGEAPTWSSVDLLSTEVKYGWLVHASDKADDIYNSGFERGVCDLTKLALTTYLSDFEKCSPGYNFALEPDSFEVHGFDRWGKFKYGKGLVVFKAPYVLIWHTGDSEPQAIFWGPDATDIWRVWQDGGDYVVTIEDDDGYGEDFFFESLEDLVDVLEKKHP
jgi:hypothetical protein